MYDEQIKRLRDRAGAFDYDGRPDIACDYEQAADAIEDMSRLNAEITKRELKLRMEKPRWIPVTERLPEKNTWVLAYCKYKDHVIDYVDINGLWSYGNVTHWMPLPQPPKEEN